MSKMPDDKLSVLTDDGLNARERRFCHDYLMGGLDVRKTCRKFGGDIRTYQRYLSRDHVRAYLKKRVDEVEEEFKVSFSDKMKKLWLICDVCFPDWANTEDLKKLRPDAAIQAIKEMNRMRGDYAPEKHIVESQDDLKVVTDILDELRKKYKKEY